MLCRRAPSLARASRVFVLLLLTLLCHQSFAALRIAIPYLAGRTSACAELQKLVADYPHDNVTINCYPGAQMPSFESQTFVASNPPYDITACAAYRLGLYGDKLADLSDMINAAEYEKRDFFDEVLHSGNEYPPNSGKYIGSPWASDMQAITYKKSVFAAHNITFPAFLEDLPAIAEYFKERSEFDGGMTMLQCTSATDPTCNVAGVVNVLSGSAIMYGLGGAFWNPDTYQVEGYVNSDRNIQSAKVVKRIFDTSINRGKYTSYAAMSTNFFNSLCGAARATPLALGYVGFAELAVLSRCPAAMQDTESVAVPFSRNSDVSSTSLALISLAIPKSSPNLAGAKRLLTYLTSRASQSKGTSWGFPVRKSVVNMPSFVLNSNGSLIGPRLVYAQSLQRGVSCAQMISNSGPVTAIHDQALMTLINGNDTSEAYIRSLYNSVASRQQALIDAVYPCGPVCPLEYQRSEPMAVALLSLHSICLILGIATGVAFIYYWKTPAVRASTPIFMVLILVGTLLMFVSGIISYEKELTDERCVAINWTMSFGMQIVFVALVIKTYRIAAIFGKKQITKVVITTPQLVRYFIYFIAAFFAYMMVWTYVSSPHVTTEKSLRADGQYEQWEKCDYGFFSTYDMLLQFLLLMCASVLAFQVRSAPSAFHEGKYLGFGLYNWVLITALVFLMNNMSTNPNIESLARSLHILLVAPVILLTSFGPKFYAAFTNADVSTTGDSSSNNRPNSNTGNDSAMKAPNPIAGYNKASPHSSLSTAKSDAAPGLVHMTSKMGVSAASSTPRRPSMGTPRASAADRPSPSVTTADQVRATGVEMGSSELDAGAHNAV